MDSMFVAMTINPITRGWCYIYDGGGRPKLTEFLETAKCFHTKGEAIDFVNKVAPDFKYDMGCEHFGYLEITLDFNLIKEI